MPKTLKITNKVKFTYVKGSDHKIFHANGAKGIITPRGEFLLDFYAELPNIFGTETYKIIADGTLREIKKKVDISRPIEMIRERQVAIIMDIESAKSLADFIYSKIEEFKQATDNRRTK